MSDEHFSGKISLDSVIITNRTRKDFGDIKSLAENISAVGLLQPIVINENNHLIDGQRRIKAYIQLGRREIPCCRVNLKEIILGEFHANSNRKELTTSERVAISKTVEEFFRKYSGAVGRPRSNQELDKNTTQGYGLSIDSANSKHPDHSHEPQWMETMKEESLRPPSIAKHFDEIESVIEYAVEGLQSLKDVMKELNDSFPDEMMYNRMTEFTTQLDDCLYSMEKGLSTLRTNFYIDPKRSLPRDRIDYVDPSVDEELK
jgi:ParB family chromosome partitioning protein